MRKKCYFLNEIDLKRETIYYLQSCWEELFLSLLPVCHTNSSFRVVDV